MTAEPMSAFLVKTLPLPCIQETRIAYYRSKLFIAPFTTNPLLAAAEPILSLLERLSISHSLPPVQHLRENIEHELLAFHSRLHGSSRYTAEFDVIAHYLLSATIDEMVGKCYLGVSGSPAEFQAFTPLSSDNKGPEERFFDIVAYIKERPSQYLDLMELVYYCLIAGFEGMEHLNPNGRQVLDNLIEELFQLIQQHRVNKSHNLFKDIKKISPLPETQRTLFTVAILSLSLLIMSFFISDLLLEHKAYNLQLSHPVIAALDK